VSSNSSEAAVALLQKPLVPYGVAEPSKNEVRRALAQESFQGISGM
jgi:hypothetical protein